jgi:hypothetical protein
VAARQDDLELVTPQAADPPVVAHRALQPAGHLLEQRIAGRVAHGIVDLFEAVEIEQEHRTGAVFHVRCGQDLFQRLRHLRPVGEPGQRIEPRQARGVLFGAALLGQVAARAAKAQVIAEAIVRVGVR